MHYYYYFAMCIMLPVNKGDYYLKVKCWKCFRHSVCNLAMRHCSICTSMLCTQFHN